MQNGTTLMLDSKAEANKKLADSRSFYVFFGMKENENKKSTLHWFHVDFWLASGIIDERRLSDNERLSKSTRFDGLHFQVQKKLVS
jgi:hypothetical protein